VNIRCEPIKGTFKVRNLLFSLKMNIVTTLKMVVIGYMSKINKPCFWKK